MRTHDESAYASAKQKARQVWLKANGPLPAPCVDCGVMVLAFGTDEGHVHHADHDPFHNEPENLKLLHAACHRALHNSSEITRVRRSAASIARNAAAVLHSPEIDARRADTLRALYATDPDIRGRVGAAVRAALADPEVLARRTETVQASWDDNDERKAAASAATKNAFVAGKIQKIECPHGCGMKTYPAPMGRHRSSGKCPALSPSE